MNTKLRLVEPSNIFRQVAPGRVANTVPGAASRHCPQNLAPPSSRGFFSHRSRPLPERALLAALAPLPSKRLTECCATRWR
jgi:hypothetical protein